MRSWEDELRNLPDPRAPASATSQIMARIRAMEPAGARAGRHPEKPHTGSRWRVLALTSGVTAILAAYTPRLLDGSLMAGLYSPRIGGWLDGVAAVPVSDPPALLLAVGLMCYLVGITALRGGS